MKEFRLPDPGEGLVEADIVTWRVAVGDEVTVNDILVEVETSKSLVELPSPYAGRVAELLVTEGQTVDVGAPIIRIDDGTSADAPVAPPDDGREAGNGEDEQRVPTLVGYGPRSAQTTRRPRKAPTSRAAGSGTASPAAAAHQGVVEAFDIKQPVSRQSDVSAPLSAHPAPPAGPPLPGPGAAPAEPVLGAGIAAAPRTAHALAKPPVRKYAKDHGVDLAVVTASRPDGVITREDVDQHLAGRTAEWAAGSVEPDRREEVRIPIKGVRKATAQAMVASAFTAPHVTEWITVDVSATVELVERLRARREFAGVKLTPLLVVMKAVCLALGRTRELNSSWHEDAQEIVQHNVVNLGVAVATPRGLVVPNVKAADRLSLLDLGRSLAELVEVARAGRTAPAAMSGGTFTITNVGAFGVDGGTPILNPGEAGILAVGAISRRPWVVGSGAAERIEPRWVTTLAVSFDHRLVDGEQGSRFLADVAGLLADPATALLY